MVDPVSGRILHACYYEGYITMFMNWGETSELEGTFESRPFNLSR